VPDADTGVVAIVDAPPHAPSPPSALNVFDFLVGEETANETQEAVTPQDSRYIENIRVDGDEDADMDRYPSDHDNGYREEYIEYGAAPLQPSFERYDSYGNLIGPPPDYAPPAYVTPAPRRGGDREQWPEKSRTKDTVSKSEKKSTDKKRKRAAVEDLDLSLTRKVGASGDVTMTDITPTLHSGLTGGLNRLLSNGGSRPDFPPSPEFSGDQLVDSPLSPMKRSKHSSKDPRSEKERGRDREPKSKKPSGLSQLATTSATTTMGTNGHKERRDRDEYPRIEIRRRKKAGRDSSSDRERERLINSNGNVVKKQYKAIEYTPHRSASVDVEPSSANALTKRGDLSIEKSSRAGKDGPRPSDRSRYSSSSSSAAARRVDMARQFTSFITKGPESDRGYSVNKALKRWHRERGTAGEKEDKHEEEKELWKGLRLRRNEKGELVVFF